MKRALWLLSFLSLAASGASLGEVKTVYLLPMSHGLDQYLANRLTSGNVLTVVADPKAADAVVTDRLGESFETRLSELYPPPAPEAKPADAEKPAGEEKAAGDLERGERLGGMSTFGKGKGNVFIVDARSRRVLWSTFEPPRDFSAAELDRAAERIAERIKKTIAGGSKGQK
jgi:hypothetical protein